MLKITGHRGFHITFKNGWTASVQFGPGSYTSSHHDTWDFEAPRNAETYWESGDAEIAAWETKDGEMFNFGSDSVRGWLNADQVLIFLNWVAGEKHDAGELDFALRKEEKEW